MLKLHFLGIAARLVEECEKLAKNHVARAGGSKLTYTTAGQFGLGANFDDSVRNFQLADNGRKPKALNGKNKQRLYFLVGTF